MEPLELSTYSLFAHRAFPESPRIDSPDVGIRLAARDLHYDGENLSVELLLSCQFEPEFAFQFQRLTDAIVLSLEDAESGRAAALSTIDPRKRFPARSGPNYVGSRSLPPNTLASTGGWVSMPLQIPLPLASLAGPSFYATAFLQQYVSNTLAFDLAIPSMVSFLDDQPFTISAQGDGDEENTIQEDELTDEQLSGPVPVPPPTTSPAAPRVLTLAPRKTGAYGPREPIDFEATLALPPNELATFGPTGWLRALFIWATRQNAPATQVGQWLGSRTVFPDSFTNRPAAGQTRAVATAPFDLHRALEYDLSPGTYYVQVSARHYRSEVVEVVVQ